MKETFNGVAKTGRDTFQDALIKPMLAPIEMIEGKGVINTIKQTTRGAIGSILSLPLRAIRDGGSGLAADLWNLVKGGGKLALHLPFIPQWRQERKVVTKATQHKLDAMLDGMEQEHQLAA